MTKARPRGGVRALVAEFGGAWPPDVPALGEGDHKMLWIAQVTHDPVVEILDADLPDELVEVRHVVVHRHHVQGQAERTGGWLVVEQPAPRHGFLRVDALPGRTNARRAHAPRRLYSRRKTRYRREWRFTGQGSEFRPLVRAAATLLGFAARLRARGLNEAPYEQAKDSSTHEHVRTHWPPAHIIARSVDADDADGGDAQGGGGEVVDEEVAVDAVEGHGFGGAAAQDVGGMPALVKCV